MRRFGLAGRGTTSGLFSALAADVTRANEGEGQARREVGLPHPRAMRIRGSRTGARTHSAFVAKRSFHPGRRRVIYVT